MPRTATFTIRCVCLLHLAAACAAQNANGPSQTLALEAEDFQFVGDWSNSRNTAGYSGSGFLFSGEGAKHPAVSAIEMPAAATYRLWVRTVDFPDARPGTRTSRLSIGGRPNSRPFGASGKAGWSWERGDAFALSKGPVLLTLEDNREAHYARVDAIVLTTDPQFIPRGPLKRLDAQKAKVVAIAPAPIDPAVVISPAAVRTDGEPLARLANEHVRVEFLAARRGGKDSASPTVSVKTAAGWRRAPLDPSAESYQVVVAAADAPPMQIAGFHPKWPHARERLATVEVAGVRAQTSIGAGGDHVVWNAGRGQEYIVRSVAQDGPQRVRLDFHPADAGVLAATWTLRPGEKTILVELEFTPAAAGQYALGYFLFNRKPLAEVDELLMPMMVQRKRFPSRTYTLLQAACPTPVSLMQTAFADGALTCGVAADARSIPHEFPIPIKSRFGMHIRGPRGLVQPSIYGPLIGAPGARAAASETMRFALRVFAQSGDWYDAYRSVTDEVFAWRDYRQNGRTSLTQAALNMIDLYMDDEYGGWWERAKASYQIESKNGSTQSTPLTALSLYYLTGDRELYERRTAPTLEFTLSRQGPHFAPIPEDTGSYPPGSMRGPVDIFGTTVFGGLWKMTNGRTPALRAIAFPNDAVRHSGTQQGLEAHNQPFDEWLGRYQFTGEATALERAVAQADAYVEAVIAAPPTRELGTQPFFLMSFVPAWEGLLRLYEATGEQRFLDAAVAGARLVMTGMWTQPTPVDREIAIHPNGAIHGDKMDRLLHKGAQEFRLGWPIEPDDICEKQAPAWRVSPVGLGFEQPATYTYKDNGGRMIHQAPWAPAFLRLALYSGDRQFETYARNAVIGRWGNYPGYYYTTFTDLIQEPRYPYEGPDIGFIYYHHLPVHLSWTIDYLVSEALLRSDGKIRFPGLRQFGYAFFDYLVYGHAPGDIMGEAGAWLWLRKDLVALDNPQINYLMAHDNDTFFLILMNESAAAQRVTVAFKPENIAGAGARCDRARFLAGGTGMLPLSGNRGRVEIEPRGLAVLAVDGLQIDVPAHRTHPQPAPATHPGAVRAKCDGGGEVRAAAIQVEPGPWRAYVWSTAGSNALRRIVLTYKVGAETRVFRDRDYPYEFSVPVPADRTTFRFQVAGVRVDGSSFETETLVIGASPDK